MTIRSYLHALLAMPPIANSPVLRSFLTADPIRLTEEEEEDARRREELDRIREEGRSQFEREVSERVDKLRDAAKGVKGELMGPGMYHSPECRVSFLTGYRWTHACLWYHTGGPKCS